MLLSVVGEGLAQVERERLDRRRLILGSSGGLKSVGSSTLDTIVRNSTNDTGSERSSSGGSGGGHMPDSEIGRVSQGSSPPREESGPRYCGDSGSGSPYDISGTSRESPPDEYH